MVVYLLQLQNFEAIVSLTPLVLSKVDWSFPMHLD